MAEEEKQKEQKEELLELEKLKRERDEYLAGWQRAKADFANYQKDEARRNEEFARWALASFITELLPVLDSFDVALAHLPKEAFAKEGTAGEAMGLQLIRNQFMSALSKYGLEPIHVQKGEKFNPELHEALSHEPSNEPEDTILEELQRGYMLHNRVLRPAKVKVASKRS